jgi:hypothetical protein
MPAVDLGERLSQLGRRVTRVPEDGQPSTRSQSLGGLGGARDGIHPVPRLAGDDRVERPAGGVPPLERGDLHLDTVVPGRVGHPRVDVHPQHLAAGGLQLPSDDARAAADVEHLSTRDRVDEVTDELGGIPGAGPVVPLRVGAE